MPRKLDIVAIATIHYGESSSAGHLASNSKFSVIQQTPSTERQGVLSNTLWSISILVILALSSLATKFLAPKVAIVVHCHNAVWAGALILFSTNLVQYTPAAPTSWLTLIAGISFFNLGAIIAGLRSNEFIGIRKDPPIISVTIVSRKGLFILTSLYTIGFIAYVYFIGQRYGFLTLFLDPASIRGDTEVSYLATVPLPVRLTLFLGPLIFALLGVRHAISKPLSLSIRLIGLIAVGLSMLALLQRTNLFVGALLLLAAQLSIGTKKYNPPIPQSGFKRSKRPPKVVSIFVLGVMLVGAFQYVGGALGKTGEHFDPTVVSPELTASGLASPFHYYTSGTAGFLALSNSTNDSWPESNDRSKINIGDNNPQTWGAALFAPLLKAVPISKPWENIAPFIDVGVLTNVYTWFEPFYRDFRLPGVVIGMSIIGFLIARMHRNRSYSPRIFWIQSLLFSTIFLAPFVAKINNTLIIFIFIVILFATRKTLKQTKKQLQNSRNI